MSASGTRNNTLLIIAIVVIVLILLCCCLVVAGLAVGGLISVPWSVTTWGGDRVEATETIEETFDVSAPVTLQIDVNVGDVVIEAGGDGEVRVYGVKRAWGRDRQQAQEYLDDFEVRIQETATGKIEIETDIPPRLDRLGRPPSVDLEITVPRGTDLDLTVNVGEAEVTGVQGSFDITSNVGDVTLYDVRFEGDSRIKSDVGNIELRLPEDIAFAFSAKTNVGDIRVDFDVRDERSEKRVVGGSIEGEIGTAPTAYVELVTNTGEIKIRQSR